MNLERNLELNAQIAKDNANEYLEDPEMFSDDDFDVQAFNDAMNQKSVAEWAVGMQVKSSYTTAKKILDTV